MSISINGEVPLLIRPRTVDEICEVDSDKRDRLLMLVLHQIVKDPFYIRRIGRYVRSVYSLIGDRLKKSSTKDT